MGWINPIVDSTVLRRPAIQSPGFASGSEGWSINADGTAEFNNLTVRGGVTEDGITLIYAGAPGAGTLVGAIAAVAGTDPYGNAYPAGISLAGNLPITTFQSALESGEYVQLAPGINALYLSPDSTTYTPASAIPGAVPVSGGIPEVVITSPTHLTGAGAGQAAALLLNGASGDGTKAPSASLTAPLTVQGQTTVQGPAAVQGLLSAANLVVGSVTITPSAANTPTSHTVAFTCAGTTFAAFTSYNSTLAGTHVTGTAVTGLSGTGATIWLTRTDTTATIVYYLIWGQ